MFRARAHHQEAKIALHRLWYHHAFRCDDTRGCVMQFWPPDDEHMCSKHVEAWNKLIVKQTFCASSWLISEINILRCTVSKTAKKKSPISVHMWRSMWLYCRSKAAIKTWWRSWKKMSFGYNCLLWLFWKNKVLVDNVIQYPHIASQTDDVSDDCVLWMLTELDEMGGTQHFRETRYAFLEPAT